MNSVTASCASSSIVVAPTGSPGLILSDFDRADRIGEFWGNPKTRTFAELLIDCEEDRDAPGGAGRDAEGDGAEVAA
jgi:hypothetical protein